MNNGFWVANFYHTLQPKHNHETIFFSCACFGPLEAITYGINAEGKLYQEHTYPNDFDESDLQSHIEYLQKEDMLAILEQEIKICQSENQTQFIPRLQQIQKNIQHFKP